MARHTSPAFVGLCPSPPTDPVVVREVVVVSSLPVLVLVPVPVSSLPRSLHPDSVVRPSSVPWDKSGPPCDPAVLSASIRARYAAFRVRSLSRAAIISSTRLVTVSWYRRPSPASHQPRMSTARCLLNAFMGMPMRAAMSSSEFDSEPQGSCRQAVSHSISSHGRTSAGASVHVSDCSIRSWSSSKRQPLARVSAGYGTARVTQQPFPTRGCSRCSSPPR
ncbi:hypothetical protein D3C86_1593810 [compost metagenome]